MYGFTVMHRSTREQPGKSRAVPFVRFCEGGKAISLGGQRPLVTDVDSQRYEDTQQRQHADHGIGAEEGLGGVVQRTGDGAAKGRDNEVGVDDGEIQGEVLQPVVGADEGGVGGGHTAVGEAAQNEADHQDGEALQGQGQDQHAAGQQEQDVHGLHGLAAASLVEQRSQNDAAHAVADGDQAHHRGDGTGGDIGADLPGDAAGLRSTDTGAVLRAAEINADAILLAKNIDGVYSADPAKDPSAVKYDAITYDEVLARHLAVMDTTATSLSMDNHIPVQVFALKDPQNILRVVMGEPIGTIVKEEL